VDTQQRRVRRGVSFSGTWIQPLHIGRRASQGGAARVNTRLRKCRLGSALSLSVDAEGLPLQQRQPRTDVDAGTCMQRFARCQQRIGAQMLSDAAVTEPGPLTSARPFRSADMEIESRQAILRAVLVDLEARAKYAKVEGAAVPLLIHAKTLNDELRRLLASATLHTRSRFEPGFRVLNGQLRVVALAFSHLCRGDVRPQST